jgi:hypothetical protein
MHERMAAQAAQQQKAFDTYLRLTAGGTAGMKADELEKLAALKSKGVITESEFETEKAKLLA